MKALSSFLCALFVMLPSVAMASDRLHVLFFERNPWLMSIGSDSPVFASYSNGLTIFIGKDNAKREAYFSVRLNPDEMSKLMAKMAKLNTLKKHYSLVKYSDQTMNELHYFDQQYAREKGALIKRTVYGRLNKLSGGREKAPVEWREVFDELTNFSHPKAKPWNPDYLEVMIWPYEYAPDKSIAWPKQWPNLQAKSTKKRGGDSFSIYLPFSQKRQFDTFIKTRTKKAAILMNGKKWALSTRIPFPHELAYNKALLVQGFSAKSANKP